MDTAPRALTRRTFLGTAALFGATAFFGPAAAWAEPALQDRLAVAAEQRARLGEMQSVLNAASDSYYQALGDHRAAAEAAGAAQDRIVSATEEIAGLQDRLGQRARGMYREGPTSLIEVFLGSSSFEEFAAGWDILNRLNEQDAEMVGQMKALREEVKSQKAELDTQEQRAQEQLDAADGVRVSAEQTVAEMQAVLDGLDAEARMLLDQEQARGGITAGADAAARAMRKTISEMDNFGYTDGAGGEGRPEVGEIAYSKIGCPYIWAAEGPSAFDCSGLVTWAYRQIGIEVTHQSESQFLEAKWRGPVSRALPGDVLYRPGHVGIALAPGGSWYVHAPTFGAYVRDTDNLAWSGFTHALRY